ncbi:MAG: hypothetical protein ACYTFY_09455 [Planctomycetota bacterium]|jgi:hypothetical protein
MNNVKGFLILIIFISAGRVYAQAEKPAVLFISDIHHVGNRIIDLNYLKELHSRGFEADYLDEMKQFSWERIKKYNCLVIFDIPYPKGHPEARPPIYRTEFIKLTERYLKTGGGVFLMKANYNGDDNVLPLLTKWDARIPLEIFKEDSSKTFMVPRMNLEFVRATFTENILSTPVSKGVSRIWFPYMEHYNGCETAAIKVSDEWQVVYKGSPSSYTVPFKAKNPMLKLPEDIFVRKDGVKSPDLFAIRDYQKGRIALTSTWPTWSLGSGTAWLYERRFLSRGFNDKPSDFQRLLDNTFSWLSAPSIKSKAVGGYKTPAERLLPPNERESVKQQYRDMMPDDYSDRIAGEKDGVFNYYWSKARNWKIYKGLYGAKSNYGGGSGSVSEWAEAARSAGLSFLVFMDDFSKITEKSMEKLKTDCRNNSDDDLLLLPGYAMKTNIGDNFFVYGPRLEMPGRNCLVGKNKDLLNLQYQDPKTGKFEKGNAVLTWILRAKNKGVNFGYYHFKDPAAVMPMYDLRLYSVAALRTYKDGKKLEDMTDDYLISVDSTIASLPVSVNICNSPQDMTREVKSGNAFTYAMASSVKNLYRDALTYAHQYSGNNVFSSDGPIIKYWSNCVRSATYGSARFASGRAHLPALMWITSEKGLKKVVIYDGPKIFRKFILKGEKELKRVLEISANLHRNLVLVAEDIDGGKAVSFPLRAYKPNTSASYCSDHINDGGKIYIGAGPGVFRMCRPPVIPGGFTWDGGPTGSLPLFKNGTITPRIKSDLGEEGTRVYANVPHLDFADEIANRFISIKNRSYADHIQALNAWYTFGPTVPNKLINTSLFYGEWHTPTIGPKASGWPAQCRRTGAMPSFFEAEITSLKEQTIKEINLVRTNWISSPEPLMLMIAEKARPGECSIVPLVPGIDKGPTAFSLKPGDWFGIYSEKPSSGIYWLNRGIPIRLQLHFSGKKRDSVFISLYGDIEGKKLQKGESFRFKLMAINYPVDVSNQGPARFMRLINYLNQPQGLKVLQGKRLPLDGVLEFKAEENSVRIQLPKPVKPVDITVPVRVSGLNPNWSAGYFQRDGYALGIYGDGKNKYTPLGFDDEGRVYGSIFPDLSEFNDIEIGHPVVSDNNNLIIQLTQKLAPGGGYAYCVAVNNPTEKAVSAVLKQNMKLPGFIFSDRKVTVSPGGFLKISVNNQE